MKHMFTNIATACLIVTTIGGCGKAPAPDNNVKSQSADPPVIMQATGVTPNNNGLSAAQQLFRMELIREYGNQAPTRWAEDVPGVFTRMATNDKVIAPYV